MISKIRQNPIKYVRLFAIICFAAEFGSRFISQIIQLASTGMSLRYFINSFFIGYVPYALFLLYLFIGYNKNKHNILLPLYYLLAAVLSFSSVITMIPSLQIIFESVSSPLVSVRYIENAIRPFTFGLTAAFLCVDAFSKFKFIKISRIIVLIRCAIYASAAVLELLQISSTVLRPTMMTVVYIWLTGTSNMALVLGAVAQFILWKYCLGQTEPDSQTREINTTEF